MFLGRSLGHSDGLKPFGVADFSGPTRCLRGLAGSRRLIAVAFALAISFALAATAATAVTLGVAWERSFSSGEESGGFQLLTARRLIDGSLLVVVRDSSGASAVRFDAEGTVLSSSILSASDLNPSAIADPFGSVVLFTYVGSVPGGYDLVVMKYDGLTGKKIWLAPARIRAVLFQGSSAAAIGPSGDVFVTAGVLGPAVGSINWATLRYDGRTGRVLWGPALYGDSTSYPSTAGPVDLAIDQAGDVVVAGFAATSDRSLWAAIKYRGLTGEKIWGPVLIGAVSTAPPQTTCPGPCYSPPMAARSAFDRNGNVFLTVSTFTAPYSQAWLTAKYDGATGALIWGPVSHKTGTQTDFDVPSAIGVNGNGDVVVGGSIYPSPYSSEVNSVNELVKYSGATGARIWGPAAVASSISSLAFDGGGQVFVAGSIFSGYPYRAISSTSDFDGRSGGKLWEENLGSAESDFSYSPPRVVVGSDGNVTTVAGAIVRTGSDQHGELQVVNRAGATGSTVWGPFAFRSRGAGTYPLDLLVDGNGDTMLVTASGPFGSILKYGRDGSRLWGPVRIPAAAPQTGDLPHAAIDFRGDVLLAGASLSKYSGASGLLLWGPNPVEGLESRLRLVTTDPAGDVLMVGIAGSGWETRKFRGLTGEIVWTSEYRPSVNSAEPADIAVDRNGDVFVTGYSYRDNGRAWVTSKYSGATGEPIWGPVLFDGIGYGSNVPKRLAVDSGGDLIVTGTGTSASGISGKTIKYSGRTGAVLWGPSETVVRPIDNYAPVPMMLDAAGDIFVVGVHVVDPLAPLLFWSTVKLRGLTGEPVWGPEDFPSPPGSASAAIALDTKGNPLVGGTVSSGTTNGWMFVKYDSKTGEVLLGPEYYDTASFDYVSQIKLVGSDTVLVGTSESLARTVRYGTLLGISTVEKDLAPAPSLCGTLFSQTFAASNGRPPLVWEVFGGSLPLGVVLDPFSGRLSGMLSESGSFSFNIRVRDAAGATAERGFTIDVLDGGPHLTIEADPEDKCLPGQYTLSVPGNYASYHWLPGGETTPEITVCPFQPTVFSVAVTEVSGCERRGSIELQPFKIELLPRQPLVPPARKRRARAAP